jgi:hypothetical protein
MSDRLFVLSRADLRRRPRSASGTKLTESAPLQRRGGSRYRISVGQRFYRVGVQSIVWRVVAVYHDAQGLEHANLIDEARSLDGKTLAASVLLDRSRYRTV